LKLPSIEKPGSSALYYRTPLAPETVMQVRKHPLSEKWIVRYFVIVFVTLSAAIVLPPRLRCGP